MGFTKLDSNIIQSSIMSEPAVVFKVWIALLASTGPDGIARVSSTFLSSACYLGLDAVDRALGILEAPDARSRSLSEEGRRVRRVDGGYFIVNYEKYRGFTPQEGDPNSSGALRTRRWRERKIQSVTGSPVVTDGDVTGVTSASASSSASVIKEILEYLNAKAGKNFNPSSSDTIKHISARIAEGRTLDDFKKVIDIKVAKWKGRTWPDTRPGREGEIVNGDDLLRPSTLFRAGNFENYVNERAAPAQAKKMTKAEYDAARAEAEKE